MKRASAIMALLVCTAALQAQIGQLATSGDGGILLFRSNFRLTTESTLGPQAKIYRWQNGVWTNLATARGLPVPIPSGAPDVFGPFASTTGDVFGWQIDLGCFPCFLRTTPYYLSEVHGATLPAVFPGGTLQISPNGRYFTGDAWPQSGSQYLDSQTGVVSDVPISSTLRPAIRQIANDGTVLLFQGSYSGAQLPSGPLSLWKPGSAPNVIRPASMPVSAAFSANGSRVASEEFNSQPAQVGTRILMVLEASTGTQLLSYLLSPSVGLNNSVPIAQPEWDSSGSVLIFRNFDSTAGNYVLQSWSLSDGNAPKTILSHAEGIANAVISGDGNIVWAVTGSNRLLRLNRSTGQLDEILPALPTIGNSFADGVAGSAYFITGSSFSADVTASDNGTALPVFSVQPDGFFVQIPWDAAYGLHKIAVRSGPGNPFEAVLSLPVTDSPVPNIVTFPSPLGVPGYAKAAHSDFSGLISPQNPARSGEIIHIYLTGLGPLDAMLPTGAAGPSSPPLHPTIPFACTVAQADATVLSVSYAPGLVGFYQADFMVPVNVPAADTDLFCEVTAGGYLFSSTARITTAP